MQSFIKPLQDADAYSDRGEMLAIGSMGDRFIQVCTVSQVGRF